MRMRVPGKTRFRRRDSNIMYEARGVATPLLPAAGGSTDRRQLLLYIQFRVITNAAGNLLAHVVFIVVISADRVKRYERFVCRQWTFIPVESVYTREVIFKMANWPIHNFSWKFYFSSAFYDEI